MATFSTKNLPRMLDDAAIINAWMQEHAALLETAPAQVREALQRPIDRAHGLQLQQRLWRQQVATMCCNSLQRRQ